MTVPSTTNRDQQLGDGLSTVFTVPFRVLDQTHLRVLSTIESVTTELALTADFAVTGVGGVNTTVTFVTPPDSAATLTFLRSVPATQETDYVKNDPFPAESHERALDKLTMLVQQFTEEQGRTIKIPPEVSGVSTELPIPVAGGLWGWDASAAAPRYYTPTDIGTTLAFSNFRADQFTAVLGQTDFVLTSDPGALANLDVSIDGVTQRPTTDYTYAGTTLTFTSPLAGGEKVLARYGTALPVGVTDASSVTFIAAAVGAVIRSMQDKARDIVSVKDYGAVMDGVTNDYAAVLAAFASGAKHVVVPPGTMYVGTTINIPAGVTLHGNGATWKVPQGVNAVNMSASGCTIRDITFDGTAVDDVLGATGVILGSDGVLMNVTCQNFGFHGFGTPTAIGSHRNTMVGCRAYNTGHRGINMSNGSTYNRVTNFMARNCARAGIILGYLSNYNVFSDIFIDGYSVTVGGAGLWVHMNSDYNTFTNVTVGAQDAAGTTCPSLILAGGCKGNSFNHIKLVDVGTRGILLWNLLPDHPELGTFTAPLENNSFNDVTIVGTNAASSKGILFQTTIWDPANGPQYYVSNNYFDRAYIDKFVDAIHDIDTLSDAVDFSDFRFGTISGRKFRVGSTADNFRNGRRRNCGSGVTAVGSLALALTEYGAQPAVPATTVAQTNYYPFPVNVYVSGMVAGSSVQINGTNANAPTTPNDGNGVHTVYPGQTIALTYAAGAPTWRWFGLDW